MLYGIADGAEVSINCEANYQEIEDWAATTSLKLTLSHTWNLYVRYGEITARVTAEALSNYSTPVVMSILLAGLKNIEDSGIYLAATAVIETKLGVAIDRDIPASVGQITDTVFSSQMAEYDIGIMMTIPSGPSEKPKLTIKSVESFGKIRIMIEIFSYNGKKCSWVDIDEELWYENHSGCMKEAQYIALKKLYENDYDPYVTYAKYMVFEDEMSKPSSESAYLKMKYAGGHFGPISNGQTYAKNPAADVYLYKPGGLGYSGEDKRVRELPALNEKVVHPVTKQPMPLREAIISLNDSSRWTREQIADWLETLDIDISFKPEGNNGKQD